MDSTNPISQSELRYLEDDDTPMMKTIKGATMGLTVGTIWGTVVATWYDVPRVEKSVALPGLLRTLKMMGNYGATFAAIGGVYIGVEQVVQHYRMKRDFINGAVGGFVAGSTVLGYRGKSITTALQAGAALAVTSALIDAGGQTTRIDNGKEYYPYTRKKRTHTHHGPGKLVVRRNFKIRADIDYVTAETAKQLVEADGYSIVDVRDKSQFARAHIKSCYHAPLFIQNEDNDIGTIVKRTVHNNFAGLFFGLPFTWQNPEFVQTVKSQFSPESKLLVVCQEGLRSTAAASQLEHAGFQNIASLMSGLQSVKPGTFDSEGSSELQNAGKAGLVTVQGKISAVLGTVLVCAFLFITFFPDQAEKLLQLFPES